MNTLTSEHQFEHAEVIDILCEDQIYEKWKEFMPTHHLMTQKTFENSRLWRWPRRSCEALFYSMTQVLPCEDFPLPTSKNLRDLHDYIRRIASFEGFDN